MAKKIKKAIPWFLVATVLLAGLAVGLNVLIKNVKAATPATEVTITNVKPAFDTGFEPWENPDSSSSSPTNEGTSVYIKATATDNNGDQWYLAVCKTDSVTANSDAPPTCAGGQTWNVSGATNSGSEATATITTTGLTESNDWYAFACDKTSTNPDCSVNSNTGRTGVGGFPFKVNHAPTFTSVSTTADDKDPGGTFTITTVSSDTDSDGGADTLTLYVCRTNATSGIGCEATQEVCSTIGAVSPNVACDYVDSSPTPDGAYTYYAFVWDNHNFAGNSGNSQTSTYTVNNVAPAISVATITLYDTDEAGDLALTEPGADTTGFKVKFTVTDANSCVIKGGTPGTNNEIDSAIVNVYRSGIGSASCDEGGEYDGDNCYPDVDVSWDPVCSQDAGTCTDSSDNSVNWTCTFPLRFYADPTVAETKFPDDDWETAAKATDDDALNSGLVAQITGSQGTEMGMFMVYALSAGDPIAYGSLDLGADSAEQTTTLQAKGNVGIDEELSGTAMSNGGTAIAAGQQNYNLTSAQGWGGTGAVALTTGTVEAELNCLKPVQAAQSPTKNTYWYLRIPAIQAAGTYNGTNTITGKTGEAGDW